MNTEIKIHPAAETSPVSPITLDTTFRTALVMAARQLITSNQATLAQDRESRPLTLFARAKQSIKPEEEQTFLQRAQHSAQFEVVLAQRRHNNDLLAVALLEQGFINTEAGNYFQGRKSYQEASPLLSQVVGRQIRTPNVPSAATGFLAVIRHMSMAEAAASEYLGGDAQGLKRYEDVSGYALALAQELPIERHPLMIDVSRDLRLATLVERTDPERSWQLRTTAAQKMAEKQELITTIMRGPELLYTSDDYKKADIFGDAPA